MQNTDQELPRRQHAVGTLAHHRLRVNFHTVHTLRPQVPVVIVVKGADLLGGHDAEPLVEEFGHPEEHFHVWVNLHNTYGRKGTKGVIAGVRGNRYLVTSLRDRRRWLTIYKPSSSRAKNKRKVDGRCASFSTLKLFVILNIPSSLMLRRPQHFVPNAVLIASVEISFSSLSCFPFPSA